MTDRSRIGRRSRRKGKTFEREIVKRLLAAGYDASRGWWQAKGGAVVPDVILPGWWIECGTGARVDAATKLRQAEANAGAARSEDRPVAIVRRKSERRIAVALRPRAGSLEGIIVLVEFSNWLRVIVPRLAR